MCANNGMCKCKVRKEHSIEKLEEALKMLEGIKYHTADDYVNGGKVARNIKMAIDMLKAE